MIKRWMDGVVCLAAIVLAAGCSMADLAVPVAEPGAPVAFRASSVESTFFAVVGTFEGTYVLEPEGVNVFIRRATIQVRDMGFYTGPRRITGFRLGTGYGDTSSRWGMHTRSELVPIERMMSSGDQVTLDSLHVFIPAARPGDDLRGRWIIFQMEEIQTAEGGRTPGPATSYAHGPRLVGPAS